MTLLTYLQHSRLKDEATGSVAIAAMLCEMLNQLESLHSGIVSGIVCDYSWQPSDTNSAIDKGKAAADLSLDNDCYSGFKSASLS